jgi:SAM-dependent methyltransferase
MAEMGEYLWLCENDRETARVMERQWREAIRAGHDVQLHLHPCWLPALGARRDGDRWSWDWSKAKADDYPGDLGALVASCKTTLERLLREERPDYRVTCFRAGAYQAQPFRRLSTALVQNGITCDSSVFRGGVSSERGYDYRSAYADHNPWFASPYDPQLKAVPAETGLVELPIFTPRPAERWFLDASEGPLIASRLHDYLDRTLDRRTTESLRRLRTLKGLAGTLYSWLKPARGIVNRVLPASWADALTEYPREEATGHDYFVLIGHTKGEHDFEAIRRCLRALRDDSRFSFVTLSQMAAAARDDLRGSLRANREEEASYQVQREWSAVMGEERNSAQSYALQDLLPWRCDTLLDLGCGSGYWSERIARQHPWIEVTGVDFGQAFIDKAEARYRLPNLRFRREDFAALSMASASFDVVYADNTIEHAFDVELTLREVFRVLRPDGTLVAALPPDGSNPDRTCDNHTWKTVPSEVRLRLEAAGFVDVRIQVRDTYRELGMPPYPPSRNQMMYIVARKPEGADDRLEPRPGSSVLEAARTMRWLYERVQPADAPQTASEPVHVLSARKALCLGYVLTLGELLERDGGHAVEYVTLLARDHERGRGPARVDSHEVLQLRDRDGALFVLDPMTNRLFPCGVLDLLRKPSLASPRPEPDARYRQRRYDFYDTSYFYERAFEACVRSSRRLIAYDAGGSWRAWLKAAAGLGRRTIHRKQADGSWRKVLLPLDPRARVRRASRRRGEP